MAHKASSSLALSACGGGDPPPLRVRGPVVKGVFIGPIVCLFLSVVVNFSMQKKQSVYVLRSHYL